MATDQTRRRPQKSKSVAEGNRHKQNEFRRYGWYTCVSADNVPRLNSKLLQNDCYASSDKTQVNKTSTNNNRGEKNKVYRIKMCLSFYVPALHARLYVERGRGHDQQEASPSAVSKIDQ